VTIRGAVPAPLAFRSEFEKLTPNFRVRSAPPTWSAAVLSAPCHSSGFALACLGLLLRCRGFSRSAADWFASRTSPLVCRGRSETSDRPWSCTKQCIGLARFSAKRGKLPRASPSRASGCLAALPGLLSLGGGLVRFANFAPGLSRAERSGRQSAKLHETVHRARSIQRKARELSSLAPRAPGRVALADRRAVDEQVLDEHFARADDPELD
jgi:hypothetical protein